MRSMIVMLGLTAFAVAALVHPAAAKKSKMGCEIGKEIWDASAGKCVPGKHSRKTALKKSKKAE